MRNFNQKITKYIEKQPGNTADLLRQLRALILEVAPNAEETFNYNIPAFSLCAGGKRDQQIMMAGYLKHVGLYPHPTVIDKFSDELKDYKKGKGSVQFPVDQPLPEELIKRMVSYRMKLLGIE